MTILDSLYYCSGANAAPSPGRTDDADGEAVVGGPKLDCPILVAN